MHVTCPYAIPFHLFFVRFHGQRCQVCLEKFLRLYLIPLFDVTHHLVPTRLRVIHIVDGAVASLRPQI